MRLHVLSLPHTQTNREAPWSACAFTQKVVKWTGMMMSLGHEVYLYGTDPDQNQADCTEYISCITEEDQAKYFDPPFPERIPEFTMQQPGFSIFNFNASREIEERKQEGDFICSVGGLAQSPVAGDHEDLTFVEFGVGYPGVFSDHKVFESYAWMHTIYGMYYADGQTPDGQMYDTVIPNYFEPEAFPEGKGDGDYLLYVGRNIARKGITIAANAAKRAGKRLIIAGGMGDVDPKYGEQVGIVGPEERAELMGGATALLAPTVYIEPFGGVTIEAMMTGTPVITTDFGVFSETVRQGDNGWRCRDLGEFIWAINNAGSLDREKIRRDAISRYSCDTIKHEYQSYFERLQTMYEDTGDERTSGFYTQRVREPGR